MGLGVVSMMSSEVNGFVQFMVPVTVRVIDGLIWSVKVNDEEISNHEGVYDDDYEEAKDELRKRLIEAVEEDVDWPAWEVG